MDYDFSNMQHGEQQQARPELIDKDIDAAGVFLNTLLAFEEADRLENLAANEESFLPSLENILAFSSYIREKIDELLEKKNFAKEPEIFFDINERNGKLKVYAYRTDIPKLSKVITSNKEIYDGMITLLSIASQTYQLLESLDDENNMPEFNDEKVVYVYGDGYLSLYKED